jgi:hypothetical protein
VSKICPDCNTPYTGRSCRCGYGGSSREEKPKNHNCSAFGCPLPGSITNSIGGPRDKEPDHRKFYCRFHFGKRLEENDAITDRIKIGELLRAEEAGKEEHKRWLQHMFGWPYRKVNEQESS